MSSKVPQSLLRRPYFLDLPPELLFCEIAFYVALLGVYGPRPLVIFLGFALLVPLHLVIVRLTRDEPQALPLLLDLLTYRTVYPAHGALVPLPESDLRISIPRT